LDRGDSVTIWLAPGLPSTQQISNVQHESTKHLKKQRRRKMRTRSVITVLKILVIEGGARNSNAHVSMMQCWAAANVVSGDCGLADSTLLPANVLPKGIQSEP
jgi:hypothetical protein